MRAPAALCFALLLGIAGCGGDEESITCTAIGCRNGVLVSLENPPSEAFRIEAAAPGETTQVQTCQSGRCTFFNFTFMPQTVSIRVILSASGATWGSADTALTYQRFFPNGPKCGGDCLQASVTVRAGP